jgi:hypothetical protein
MVQSKAHEIECMNIGVAPLPRIARRCEYCEYLLQA